MGLGFGRLPSASTRSISFGVDETPRPGGNRALLLNPLLDPVLLRAVCRGHSIPVGMATRLDSTVEDPSSSLVALAGDGTRGHGPNHGDVRGRGPPRRVDSRIFRPKLLPDPGDGRLAGGRFHRAGSGVLVHVPKASTLGSTLSPEIAHVTDP